MYSVGQKGLSPVVRIVLETFVNGRWAVYGQVELHNATKFQKSANSAFLPNAVFR